MNTYDYEENYNSVPNKKGNSKLYLIIGIIIVIGIFSYIFINKYLNSYSYYEKLLVKASINYKETTSLTYIDNYKLNVKLKDNCKNTSGVFIENGIITPYLICDDYVSNIFVDNTNISLNGDKILFLPINYNYTELGVNGYNNIKPTGFLNNKITGVYKLSYNVNSNVINRYVVVTDNPEITSLYPKISLIGDSLETLVKLNDYNDSGVVATDRVDGDITKKVIKTGNVNTSIVGDYVITYKITNSRGYSNYVTRKISIVDGEKVNIVNSDISTLSSNSDVSVDYIITGDNYNYCILPNGKMTDDRVFSYSFSENGNYKVTCYSKDDTTVEKTFNITNINKDTPKGTCLLNKYYSYTDIVVNAKSNTEIVGYKYKYNGSETEFKSSSTLRLNDGTTTSEAKVIVTNKLGSVVEINCSLKDYSNDPGKLQPLNTPLKVYTDSNGKQCLSGHACFIQSRYSKSGGTYKFCSTGTPESCGTVSQHGCSLISFTQILSGYVRKSDGTAYDPYEILAVHPCTGYYCSGWSFIKKNAETFGLSTSGKYVSNIVKNKQDALNYLKKGLSLEVRVGSGGSKYVTSPTGGHLMALLAYDEKNDLLYIADTGGPDVKRNGCPVNTWANTDLVLDCLGKTGSEYLAIGPKELF